MSVTQKTFLLFDPMQSEWFDNSTGECDSASDENLEDPAGKETTESNSIFLKNGFRNWKLSLSSVDISIPSRGWTCLKTKYLLQTDGSNCGVYVVLTLARMMTGLSEEKVTFGNSETELTQHRRDIHDALELHSIF
jgi:hypothetical protein